MVLICDSTGRSEILGEIPFIAMKMAKLHSSAPRAILLPFFLQLMKFNFFLYNTLQVFRTDVWHQEVEGYVSITIEK